jgi:Bacterial alpha-L-rhamnosidase 6 hairpin glycosidase domain/DDE superfamily endonuclease
MIDTQRGGREKVERGFRYVKVDGFIGTPTSDNFTGITLSSDLPETGTFTCSDPLINQLQHNILWSQKSNFVEIPTDCPTRERLGWTGDTAIYARTGSFLMQTARFYARWLKDLASEQQPDGRVPNIVPNPGGEPTMGGLVHLIEGSAGWGDAAVIVPWTLYQVFGDQRILAEQVRLLVELYTHPLAQWERVLCVDVKTNLQPRPRLAPTKPTRPGLPTRVEHEYKRAGALHLFAAFDTRTGKVSARTTRRKRQAEFITLLTGLDREIEASVRHIFLVLDNASIHRGKQVQAWLAAHPRFICHFLPAHCSWMNQVEQWFSMLQRKRLRISDFASLAHLAERLMAYVSEWNAHAHPFNWSTKSAAKVMAKCDPRIVHPLAA